MYCSAHFDIRIAAGKTDRKVVGINVFYERGTKDDLTP